MSLGKNLREILHLLLSGVPAFVACSSLYVRLRRRLSATPRRFEPPGPLSEWRQGEDWRNRKIVFPETDLVVEGFPGSGNSFVSSSLRDALGPRVHVTSHFHHTVQLTRAIAFGVPAVVVVRLPRAAASSLKSKDPGLWDALILWRWIVYHRFVIRHFGELDVFLFDEIVGDPDLIRRRSAAVGRLLDREIVPDSSSRRASEDRVEICCDRLLEQGLLRIAGSLYERIRTLVQRSP